MAIQLRKCVGHAERVNCVACSPDGRHLASGGQEIKVWAAATCQVLRALDGPENQVRSVAFSSDGRRLASCSAGSSGYSSTVSLNTPGEECRSELNYAPAGGEDNLFVWELGEPC